MNCKTVAEKMAVLAWRVQPQQERQVCMNHIASCPDCSDALRGAEALVDLSVRKTENAPPELFDNVIRRTTRTAEQRRAGLQFWLGTGFGGAIAASLLVIALALGWFGNSSTNETDIAEFVIVLDEPRRMDLAIEIDRPLKGATISILLAGSVEIDGFSGRRELTWTTDLDAGVNRLSLPLVGIGENGGQLVVRLSHPLSEQVFIVNLRAGA